MSDRLSNAQALYPSSATPVGQPPESKPRVDSQPLAEEPRGEQKAMSQPPTETPERESSAQAFYGDPEVLAKSYEPIMASSLDQLLTSEEIPGADRTEVLHEAVTLFNEISMPPGEASQFMGLYASAMTNKPIGDDQIEQWNTSVAADLTTRYGKPDYEARMGKVRAFVKSVPGLTEALEISGLGSHPLVVGALMERAHQLKARAPR